MKPYYLIVLWDDLRPGTASPGKRVIEKAKVCHKGMQAGCCFPNPGWQCASCGHQSLCAKWPDLPDPVVEKEANA